MLTQAFSSHSFDHKARQIMARAPSVLRQWGLMPRFMRWRLTQDPSTGMVVLFGVLNDKLIAAYTQTPFAAYFDPRLLHDLATDLHVQVVASDSHVLRYAFVLDWGQLGIVNQSTALLTSPADGMSQAPLVLVAALMPGLFFLPEEYDDAPRISVGPHEDFSEVADNLARIGRKWGLTAPVDVPTLTAKKADWLPRIL